MVKKPKPPGLCGRVYNQVEPHLEAWLVNLCLFALVVLSLLIAHYGFRVLRVAGVDEHYIRWLEREEQAADGLVFTLFLIAVVRHAALSLLGASSSPSQVSPHD